MLYIGIILMLSGLIIGEVSIFKAAKQTISPTVLGLMCYGGLFVAMIGSIFVGKVW